MPFIHPVPKIIEINNHIPPHADCLSRFDQLVVEIPTGSHPGVLVSFEYLHNKTTRCEYNCNYLSSTIQHIFDVIKIFLFILF